MVSGKTIFILFTNQIIGKLLRKYLRPMQLPSNSVSSYFSRRRTGENTMGEKLATTHECDAREVKAEVDKNKMQSDDTKKKSLLISYFYWLFGGFFGLHHLYLNRDVHAFIHWSSFNGYFGFGWVVDLFQIPGYVRDFNEDTRFVGEFRHKLRTHPKPPFSTYRFSAAVCISYLWGSMAQMAIPQSLVLGIDFGFLHWLIPLNIALGVWLVGNIGRENGNLGPSLLSAYASYLLRFLIYDETIWMTITVFVTATVFDHYSKQWRLQIPKKNRSWKRWIVGAIAVVIYLSFWTSYLCFNGTITDNEGDEVPITEAFHNFIKSPIWADLKQNLVDLWVFAQHHGWSEIWKQMMVQMDADGSQNAYKILDVSPTASQMEIKSAWKKLSLEHHPDKAKDEQAKELAHQKFMEIQQAYEILSKNKSKRKSRNKKFEEEL